MAKRSNTCLQTDSYKISQWKQRPPGITKLSSYLESRGGKFAECGFFGLQPILEEMEGEIFDESSIKHAGWFTEQHFRRKDVFNWDGWRNLLKKHKGTLPLRICSVPEGTTMPVRNVMLTIENTDDEFAWLPQHYETKLMKVWYPSTVFTLSREVKKICREWLLKTGCSLDGLEYMLHDFGYRGVSSEQSAGIGGAAHLMNFLGTDNIAGILHLQEHYGKGNKMYGFTLPAMEHSSVTPWGRDREVDAFRNMLEQFPTGAAAVVVDSYDMENAVANILGEQLRDMILKREGLLVVRPDSGDPVQIVSKVLNILGEKLGFHTNQSGFRVLCPKIRVIQGDGINYRSVGSIFSRMRDYGWAAENICFGMGAALLQQMDRDTQEMALKCSWIEINGVGRDVWKEPKTDPLKNSKRGRIGLRHSVDEFGQAGWATTPEKYPGVEQLVVPFENGKLLRRYTVEEIRTRAAIFEQSTGVAA